MEIKVGTDILNIERFLASCENGGKSFLDKIFTPQELRDNTKEQLASIFCLKEAVVKALSLPVSSWLEISTRRMRNGKLEVSLMSSRNAQKIKSMDTSVSHEGELVIAVVAIIIDNN